MTQKVDMTFCTSLPLSVSLSLSLHPSHTQNLIKIVKDINIIQFIREAVLTQQKSLTFTPTFLGMLSVSSKAIFSFPGFGKTKKMALYL